MSIHQQSSSGAGAQTNATKYHRLGTENLRSSVTKAITVSSSRYHQFYLNYVKTGRVMPSALKFPDPWQILLAKTLQSSQSSETVAGIQALTTAGKHYLHCSGVK